MTHSSISTQALSKAVNANDFQDHVAAWHSDGERVVDHDQHVDFHPEPVNEHRDEYAKDILYYPRVIGPTHQNSMPGISPKKVYTALSGRKYLVKPYHEDSGQGDMPYPLAGWAEMCSQELYHAGSIGYLHQPVHVAMHPTKADANSPIENKPMIVVGMNPKAKHIHMLSTANPHIVNDAMKIGLMDFLCNNNDRHHENVLWVPDDHGRASQLLSIDHGRAFQYHTPNRWTPSLAHDEDHLFHYLKCSPGLKYIGDLTGTSIVTDPAMGEAMDWWWDNKRSIQSAFEGQLDLIKHAILRNYLRRNFDHRAEVLTRLSAAWDDYPNADYYNPYLSYTDALDRQLEIPEQVNRVKMGYVPVEEHTPLEYWDQMLIPGEVVHG